MPEESVELVRAWYEHVNRTLTAYHENPGPLEEVAGVDELLELAAADIEWDWLFSREVFRGHRGLLEAAAQFLDMVGDWNADLEEVVAGTGDRAVATVRVTGRGKTSDAPVEQRVFAVLTLRNGRVARIEDFTDKAPALEAAGARE